MSSFICSRQAGTRVPRSCNDNLAGCLEKRDGLRDGSLTLRVVQKLKIGQAEYPNACWSVDFMADCLFDGRRFRVLTVVDNCSREYLAAEPGLSLKGDDVVAVMDSLVAERGAPDGI